jgi:alpha-beta hydrolase superfamily lysophospholipase
VKRLAAGRTAPAMASICKGLAISSGLRLFLDHLEDSELINVTLTEYWTVIMRCMREIIRLGILMLTGVIVSCTTIPDPYAPPPEGTDSVAVFYSRWVNYLDRVDPGSLQNDCRPRLVEPDRSVPYRGTVVLLHSFTACPQQFFELSELLALQGFRSMLILLPGHGRQFEEAAGDNLRGLSSDRNWEKKYAGLAAEVNGIMAYAEGDRVIGGLSAGGAASLYINSQAAELYDRHILFAPFFAPSPGSASDQTGSATSPTPIVSSAAVSLFGTKQACLEKRGQGRAGICDYQEKHLAALNALGRSNLETVRESPLTVRLQLVGVEKDTVVSNIDIGEFLRLQEKTDQTSACFFPDGVPHEMISQYEFPGVEMYWMDSLLNGSIGFITVGQRFPPIGKVSVFEAPFPVCAMETERRD